MKKGTSRKFIGVALTALMLLSIFSAIPMNVAAAGITLSFSDGTSQRQVTAGSSVVYNIKVENTESGQRSVNMTRSGVPALWTAVFQPSDNYTVNGYSSTTFTLRVTAPSTATAETVGTIIITANHQLTAGGSSGSESITSITTVKQTYSIQTSTTDIDKDIGPGSSANFNMNITNSGNGIDTVNISILNKPSGWSISAPSSSNVNPFSFSNVPIPCFVPSDALAGQYSFTARATSENSAYYSEQTYIVNVTAKFGVSLQAVSTVKYVNPGDTAVFSLNLTNTGNKQDSYDIGLTINKAGWFANTNPNPVSNVVPTAKSAFSVLVTAPNNAVYNEQATINVTVTSQGDNLKQQKSSLVAIVNKIHGVDLNPTAFTVNIDAGSSTSMNVSVSNNGNGEDTFKLQISNVPSHLTVNFNQSQLTIPKGGSKQVTLNMNAVDNSVAGNNKITLRAYASDDATKEDKQNITITVNQKYDVLVQTTGANTKHAEPGGSVTFNLSVKNRGNGEDTIFLDATGSGIVDWNYYFTPASVNDLAPSLISNVVFTVELPDNATPGSKQLTITATSDGDSMVTSQTPVTVIADPFHKVEISTPNPYNSTLPNASAQFLVTVRNKGSGTDTFTMSATGQNPSWVSFSKSSMQLAPEAFTNVTVTVAVPSGTPIGNVTQQIVATSSGGTGISASVQIITEVKQKYKVQLTASPPTKDVDPGASANFLIYVKNTGNGNDQYFVQLDTNPNLWGSTDLASPYMTLSAGQIQTFNLTVTVPSDANSENLTYIIKATSQGDTAVFGTVDAVAAVDPLYGVDVSGIITTNEAEPTEMVQYQIKVKNTGNKQDTFRLDALGNYRAWASLSETTLVLPSDGDQRVYINVTVPDKKAAGSYEIDIKVTSQGDDVKTMTVILTVDVVQKHDIKLVSTSDVLQRGDPGTDVTFKINVTNLADEADTVDLEISSAREPWCKLSQYQLVDIPAGGTRSVTLTVSIPGNARPETFLVSIVGTEDDRGRSKTLNLTVVVNQIYDLDVTSPLTEQEVTPGFSVDFNLDIENKGTGPDTFQVSAQNHSDWMKFNKTSIIVTENGTASVKVTVTIPSIPLPATGDHTLLVRVKSIGDESVYEDMELKITISQVYGVKVTSNVSVAFVDPGKSAKYTLTVENKGNGKDTFVISKSGDNPSWISINPISVTLEKDKTTTVQVTLQVPSTASQQDLTNTLTVTSQGNTSKVATLDLTTHVNLVYGVEVTPTSKSKTIKTPDAFTYSVTVKNTGSGNDTFIFEVIGEHKEWVSFNRTSIFLAPDKSGNLNVTVDVPFENPFDQFNGTYNFDVKVISQGYSFEYDICDLEIKVDIQYGFEMAWDKTTQDAGPGETIDYNVTITNRGNIQDTYTLTPLGSYSTWLSFANQNNFGQPYNVSLGRLNSKKIRVYVKVPKDQPNLNYNIDIEVKSVGNDTLEDSQRITVKVSEVYAQKLEVDENNLDVGPDSTVVFDVKVENTGNVLAEFELEIDKVQGTKYEWADPPYPNTFNLSKEKYRWVKVNVTPPDDATEGTFTIKLKVTITNADPSKISTTIDLKVLIDFDVELKVKSRERSKEVVPGHSMTYNFTVKNLGSGDDIFTLEIDEKMLSDDDFAKWVSFSDPDLAVQYDTEEDGRMTIDVPADAEKNDYTFRLKAMSYFDENIYATYDFTLSVLGIYGVNLSTEDDIPEVEPGNSVVYHLDVENKGNTPDTYTVSAEGDNKEWVTLSKISVYVPYDDEAEVLVTITVADDAEYGSYNLTIMAKSTEEESKTKLIKLQVDVELMVEFELSADDTSLDGKPGDNVTYEITIENLGNGDDRYEFEVSGGDRDKKKWVTFEWDELAVAYDDKEMVQVYINIDDDYDEAEAGDFEIIIKVISLLNDSKYKTIKLTTEITQEYLVTLTAEEDVMTLDLNGDDAEWEIEVKNEGNGDDLMTFKIDQRPSGWQKSWFSFNPLTLNVEAGRTRTMTVKLWATKMDDVDAGSYYFRIVAVSGDGETESESLRLEVTVIKAEIEISSVRVITDPIVVEETVSIEVKLRNVGDAESGKINVQVYYQNSPVATTTVTSLDEDEDTTITLNWEPTEEGSGSLVVKATHLGETTESTSRQVEVTKEASFLEPSMDNPVFLGILLLIIILVILAIVMAARKKPAPPPLPPPFPEETGPAGEEEEEAGGEEEEEEEAGGEEEEEEAGDEEEEEEEDLIEDEAAPAPKPKVAKIRCPKCKEIMEISSPKRPLEVRCSGCNSKLLLKK